MKALVSQDRGVNALGMSVIMASPSAYIFDTRPSGRHDALGKAIDEFALTPAMCRTICEVR